MDPRPDTPREDAAGDPLLGRVQAVAQAITDRVRAALTHHRPAPAGAPVRPPDARPDRALRALVVDDNPDAADALAAVAELLGCEARACYGGPDALAALAAEVPDVLLLDLSMPQVSGLEVAAVARQLAGARPLLLVATTALGALEDRTATALAGFHFHLVKPVETAALRAALDRFRALYRSAPLPDPPAGPAPAPA